MRFRKRACAAAIAAAALFICFVCVSSSPARADSNEDARIMLFSGSDLWRNGAFVTDGFVLAPSGLDQDGLLLKILFSAGLYRYEASNLGGQHVIGTEFLEHILPGWRIKRGDAEIKVFSEQTFRNTICGRTIHPIGCVASPSVCASRAIFGTNRRRE
jgi:Cellulose biosynthesis protein BcsS